MFVSTKNNADIAIDSIIAAQSIQKITPPRLTPREKEVLQLIFEGLPSQEVADRLSVSKRTISFNLASIYKKLGVQTRLQAVVQARQLGLLNAPKTEAADDSPTDDIS